MEEMNEAEKELEKQRIAEILIKIARKLESLAGVDKETLDKIDYNYERRRRMLYYVNPLKYQLLFFIKIISEQQEKKDIKPEFEIESKYLFGNVLKKMEESMVLSKLIKEEKPISFLNAFYDCIFKSEISDYICYRLEWNHLKYCKIDNIMLNIIRNVNKIKLLKIFKNDQISTKDLWDIIEKCFRRDYVWRHLREEVKEYEKFKDFLDLEL